jgi:UDP-3-O-[3-hydroxymyristoyl] glucosamine N-acyltransferase
MMDMVDLRFHSGAGPIALSELLAKAGHGSLLSNDKLGTLLIRGAAELETAQADQIGWAGSNSYAQALSGTHAAAVVVNAALAEHVPAGTIAIVTPNPQGVFLDIIGQLHPDATRSVFLGQFVDPNSEAFLETGVWLGSNVIVGHGVEIGSGTIIGPNTVIGAYVTIGRNCVIGSNCTLECSHIGDNVVIQPGTRIGIESFGFIDPGRTNRKVPQLGRVIVQDNVEIGANSAIDRGALGDTMIGEGTKIGNLVEISHNCWIGRNCILVSFTALAGSTILEDSVVIAGNVTSAGHLTVGAGSLVHGGTALTKSWPAGSKLAGRPAQDIKDFWREQAAVRRIAKGEGR